MECPPHSHYEVCADTCSLGCWALNTPQQCPEGCAEGCECDSGFLYNGKACVPIEQCGCYHNGVYYEVRTQPYRTQGLFPDPPRFYCSLAL